MSVTPTPYGANAYVNGNPVNPSYFCLLSPPDTDTNVLNNILTGRHVLRGSSYNSLTVPDGSGRTFPSGGVLWHNIFLQHHMNLKVYSTVKPLTMD